MKYFMAQPPIFQQKREKQWATKTNFDICACKAKKKLQILEYTLYALDIFYIFVYSWHIIWKPKTNADTLSFEPIDITKISQTFFEVSP